MYVLNITTCPHFIFHMWSVTATFPSSDLSLASTLNFAYCKIISTGLCSFQHFLKPLQLFLPPQDLENIFINIEVRYSIVLDCTGFKSCVSRPCYNQLTVLLLSVVK